MGYFCICAVVVLPFRVALVFGDCSFVMDYETEFVLGYALVVWVYLYDHFDFRGVLFGLLCAYFECGGLLDCMSLLIGQVGFVGKASIKLCLGVFWVFILSWVLYFSCCGCCLLRFGLLLAVIVLLGVYFWVLTFEVVGVGNFGLF